MVTYIKDEKSVEIYRRVSGKKYTVILFDAWESDKEEWI